MFSIAVTIVATSYKCLTIIFSKVSRIFIVAIIIALSFGVAMSVRVLVVYVLNVVILTLYIASTKASEGANVIKLHRVMDLASHIADTGFVMSFTDALVGLVDEFVSLSPDLPLYTTSVDTEGGHNGSKATTKSQKDKENRNDHKVRA